MSSTVVYLALSFLCLSLGSIITASGQGQMTDLKVLERGDDWQCASIEERERTRNEVHQIANSAIASSICNGTPVAPIITTTTPLPTVPTVLDETTTSVMSTTATTGCSGPGWRRVAFINMTDTSYNCPTGLTLTSYSKRTCGRSHTTRGGCSSTTFSVGGLPYSGVCGRIRAYQFGSTDAFLQYTVGINSHYVAGISLTRGGAGRRQHIWTFAAGVSEVNSTELLVHKCPCDISRNYARVPAFVGNDYFCESGLHSVWNFPDSVLFYPNDVLWDGWNCTSTSTCCQFNNPPWFTKNLPNVTTDDIELRLCTSYAPHNEDVPIELIELYVQ